MSEKLLIKKIFYGLLVFSLMLIPIMKPNAANDTYTITITSKEGMKEFTKDRFTAYQLFSGKVNDKDQNQLSDIQWGEGVDETNLLNELKQDEDLGEIFNEVTDEDSALKVAEILQSKSADDTFLRKFSRIVKKHVTTGTKSVMDGTNAKITVSKPGYYIVIDNDNNNPNQKNSISDFILEVLNNKTVAVKADIPSITKTVNGGKGTTAEIGSDVTFTLTGTIADTYDRYETYYYEFEDTLSEGFTLYNDSITVKINDVELSSNNYKKTIVNNKLTIVFDDLKTIKNPTIDKNSVIKVEYKAKVNEKAKINNTDNGNTNQAKIIYSNDPNKSDSKGESATTTVYVYTLSLDITKVDADTPTNKLADAKFVLMKDGKYAQFDENKKLTGWVDSENNATVLTSDSQGKIHIEGLSKGTYSLKETEAPVGYDLLKNNVTFTIDATINEAGLLTGKSVSVSSSNANVTSSNNSDLAISVPNNYSKVLPSTGGIGTIIFYVLGGLLLVGASCYIFFAKKKEK